MVDIIYTIGYAGFSIGAFVDTLRGHGVSALVDVRSSPFSGYHQDYNKDQLERTLHSARIYYRSYAREFGARQPERSYYPRGYLDFELLCADVRRDRARRLPPGDSGGPGLCGPRL